LTLLYFRKISPWLAVVSSAASWITLEYVRSFFLTGFPWALLGYSQWRYPPLCQIAEWTGVYGVSAILFLSNLMLWQWLKNKKMPWSALVPLMILLGVNFGIYVGRLPLAQENPTLKVAILQGNIDQYKKWNAAFVQEILMSYAGLTKQLNSSVDLVVWPESAVPGWVPNEAWLMEWLQQRIVPTQAYHLVGAASYSNGKNYNSAFLFNPNGTLHSRYDKIHLVPLGEFVPFQSLLGRWISVLNALGGFHKGENRRALWMDKTKFGVNICYESIFPHLVRLQTKEGASFLVNVTNDGWYLNTAAPQQHFSMNVFRAIENRRTLIRAANTGISGIILPDGWVAKATALNERTLLEGVIHLKTNLTFYVQYGDVFAWLCCAIALLGIWRVLTLHLFHPAETIVR
jgi:apolipoprotein N-acyltransferase